MKLYGRELRLECLKLANTLAVSKNIAPGSVLAKAQEFYDYIDNEPGEGEDAGQGLSTLRDVQTLDKDPLDGCAN